MQLALAADHPPSGCHSSTRRAKLDACLSSRSLKIAHDWLTARWTRQQPAMRQHQLHRLLAMAAADCGQPTRETKRELRGVDDSLFVSLRFEGLQPLDLSSPTADLRRGIPSVRNCDGYLPFRGGLHRHLYSTHSAPCQRPFHNLLASPCWETSLTSTRTTRGGLSKLWPRSTVSGQSSTSTRGAAAEWDEKLTMTAVRWVAVDR